MLNASAAAEALLARPTPSTFGLPFGLPSGLPLALRTCESRYDQWQVWRMAANASHTHAAQALPDAITQLGGSPLLLVAYPRLCLGAGPSVPLRPSKMGAVLAQMRPCDAASSLNLAVLRRLSLPDAPWMLWAPKASESAAVPPADLVGSFREVVEQPTAVSMEQPTAVSMAAERHDVQPLSNASVAALRLTLARFVAARGGSQTANGTPTPLAPEPPWSEAGVTPAASNVRGGVGGEATAGGVAAAGGGAETWFAGKHGAWRRAHADMANLFTECNTSHTGGARPDKRVRDCEAWCRPQRRPRHCNKCKCAACRGCTRETSSGADGEDKGGAAPSVEASTASQRAVLDEVEGRCLGVWRDDPLDAAPLVFTPCAPLQSRGGVRRQRRQQQRWNVDVVSGAGSATAFRLQADSHPHLCVTAHPVDDG